MCVCLCANSLPFPPLTAIKGQLVAEEVCQPSFRLIFLIFLPHSFVFFSEQRVFSVYRVERETILLYGTRNVRQGNDCSTGRSYTRTALDEFFSFSKNTIEPEIHVAHFIIVSVFTRHRHADIAVK